MSEHGLLPGPVVPAVPVEWRKCLFPRIGEGVVSGNVASPARQQACRGPHTLAG